MRSINRDAKIKCAIALFGMAVLLASIFLLVEREPSYSGRSLNSWLQQCSDTPQMETQQLAEAHGAIEKIGANRALPHLLKLIKTKDTPVRVWLVSKTERFNSRRFHWYSAAELREWGIAGFEVLGTNCAAAVGELRLLLADKELAFDSARCLEPIGKPAEAALCECLTNQNWQVRNLSVSALAGVTDDVEVYLDRIKDRLKDVEPAVRFSAVQAIGARDTAQSRRPLKNSTLFFQKR